MASDAKRLKYLIRLSGNTNSVLFTQSSLLDSEKNIEQFFRPTQNLFGKMVDRQGTLTHGTSNRTQNIHFK